MKEKELLLFDINRVIKVYSDISFCEINEGVNKATIHLELGGKEWDEDVFPTIARELLGD